MNTDISIFAPEEIIQRQLDAYNARDIDSFMANWADDALYLSILQPDWPAVWQRYENGI
jgi:hypothetical protein